MSNAQRKPPELDRLGDILEHAHIPTLLMVLYQLTGEECWLEDPYRPARARGQEEHASGGLPDDVQSEIRRAAAGALRRWFDGQPAAVPDPDAELIGRMLRVLTAEDVPDEYADMARVEMGFEIGDAGGFAPEAAEAQQLSAIIVGAGVSGLAAAKYLQDRGITFTILEKNVDAGGVWHENHYPGAGVDVPSYLYSFSFHRHDWATYYSKQPEMGRYMEDAVDALGIRDAIEFDTEVTGATWDDQRASWIVRARHGGGAVVTHTANLLIAAPGLFSPPKVPDVRGADAFEGAAFHSSRWPAGMDVAGKRVAVVGSGASAMQIVPALSRNEATDIVVFQRTPQWVAPMDKYFDPVPPEVHWLMRHVPFYHGWYRFRLAWVWNDKVHPTLRLDPDWQGHPAAVNVANDKLRQYMTSHVETALAGHPELIEASIPDYPPFGKRLLLDNGWYEALKRPNVQLVPEGVEALDAAGVITESGERHHVDVVVWATGFETNRYLFPMEIVGRGGVLLSDAWNDTDPRAYLGITVPGFPNLFLMYGPNTNPPGGSWIWIGEAQARYIADLGAMMIAEGITVLEPTQERYEGYTRRVDEETAQLLWSHPNVHSYYKNPQGRVVTNSPWRVVDYWQMLKEPDLSDFDVERVRVDVGR